MGDPTQSWINDSVGTEHQLCNADLFRNSDAECAIIWTQAVNGDPERGEGCTGAMAFRTAELRSLHSSSSSRSCDLVVCVTNGSTHIRCGTCAGDVAAAVK